MSEVLQEVQLSLAEFDREQLPEDQRDLQGDEFCEAVREHLAAQFANERGAAEVIVTGDRIIIRWMDSVTGQSLAGIGIEQLKAGQVDKGIATLRQALKRNPSDHVALLNLGMALTEQGDCEESIAVLGSLLDAYPDHAPGWVALGVAQARVNRNDEAIASLQKATVLYPGDGYAHKNLGALLAKKGHLTGAIPHLQQAVSILPRDAQAWLNLAMAWEQSGEADRACLAYQKVLDLDTTSEVGKRAEESLSRMAAATFRQQSTGLRPDAVTYCLKALERFKGMPKSEVQKIAFEIAMLGSRGIDVSAPDEKYQLQSIPGKFSGLNLLCLQYVGFQIIDPSIDLGFDLSAEFKAAMSLHQRGEV
jgi:Flp pilus assembly protein TadD